MTATFWDRLKIRWYLARTRAHVMATVARREEYKATLGADFDARAFQDMERRAAR